MKDGLIFANGKDEVIVGGNVAYLGGINAAVYTEGPPPAVKPTEPNPLLLNNVFPYANWGDDNLFPQKIIDLASQNTELASLLDWKSRAAQGKEVLPFTRVYNEKGNKLEDKFVDDPEIIAFLTSRQFKRYLREAYTDFFWFWNVFPDLIKSKDGKKIAYLGAHDASHCRWSVMNDKHLVEKCWITPNWGLRNGQVDEKTALLLDVLDPYDWDGVNRMKNNQSIKRFVYPVSYPSPGKTYYQLATWDGFRTSGWLEIASQVPAFKKAIMTNQMHIKYLIKIPTNYWPSVYHDWENLSQVEKDTKKAAKLDEINTQLTNAQNAGKSILNEVGYDVDNNVLPGWSIEVIDDKLKEGAYIADSQEASACLMRALGLDDTLLSKYPGNGQGAGSGSDKRVAFNLYCALQNPYRDTVLEPLHFIAEYNGWKEKYPTLTFKTVEVELQTLDVAHQTSQEAPK